MEIQQRDARVEDTCFPRNMEAREQQKNWNLGKVGSIYKRKTNLKSHAEKQNLAVSQRLIIGVGGWASERPARVSARVSGRQAKLEPLVKGSRPLTVPFKCLV